MGNAPLTATAPRAVGAIVVMAIAGVGVPCASAQPGDDELAAPPEPATDPVWPAAAVEDAEPAPPAAVGDPERLPLRTVDRPLTLPRGVLRGLAGLGIVGVADNLAGSFVGELALGVVPWLEVGASTTAILGDDADGGFRSPSFRALARFFAIPALELGVGLRWLAPIATNETALDLSLALLWRAAADVRVDVQPSLETLFDEGDATVAFDTTVLATHQPAAFFFWGGQLNVGWAERRDTEVDAGLFIGFNTPRRRLGFFDVRTGVLLLGVGQDGFSRGGGGTVTIALHPDLY